MVSGVKDKISAAKTNTTENYIKTTHVNNVYGN